MLAVDDLMLVPQVNDLINNNSLEREEVVFIKIYPCL